MGEVVPSLDSVPGWAIERVERFSREERLFRSGQRALVAVSGGPDSVAALLILCKLRDALKLELLSCHFDHRLRPDSGDDRAWVRDLCTGLGVDCLTGEGDVAGLAREDRAGIERAARTMRYRFLAFAASQRRADSVVTGHTADDQAETVLMHLLRGSGIRGIRGMVPSSFVPGSPAIRLVRPILVLDSRETLAVCRAAGVDPRRDPSNADLSMLRNRLRHETLPALEAINPAAGAALLRLARNAREAFRPAEQAAARLVPQHRSTAGAVFSRSRFAELGPESRVLVIERELTAAKLPVDLNRTKVLNLDQILKSGHGHVDFGEGQVEVSAGQVRVGPPPHDREADPAVLNVPGVTVAAGWRIEVATDPLGAGEERARPARIRPEGTLRARPLLAGDRVFERGRWRRAKDLFSTRRVPVWERRQAIAIIDRRGVLLATGPGGWVCGGDDNEEGCLHVRLEPLANDI